MLGIGAKLRDRLRDQDVEPVETFGLVPINVVVRLAQDGRRGQGRGVPQDAGALPIEGLRGVAWGGAAEREEGSFVGEGSGAAFGRAESGGHVGGGRVAEDEELYEGADEDDDGELAEE